MIYILLIVSMLAGCGYRQTLRHNCHGGQELCNNIFGQDEWDQDDKLNELQQIVAQEQTRNNQQDQQLADLNQKLVELNLKLGDLTSQLNNLQSGNDTAVNSLTAQILGVQTQITTLQMQESVTDYIMPCGQHSGYNEVILRMKSGKNVCFFENGSHRFLSVLLPGNYMLSDGSNCLFSVNNQNLICTAGLCR